MDRFEYFFSLTWKFDVDSKSDIILYLKWLTGPQMSNFLIMDRFEYIFSLTWKFDGDSKSDIEVYLKWLTGPQKFVIMIRCKINFNIIWYTIIFAANLYLSSIFVWSSDILNFVSMNVVILVCCYLTDEIKSNWLLSHNHLRKVRQTYRKNL